MLAVRTPWTVTTSVWKALFLRETLARVSAGRAAWLWLLIEPLAHVVFLMVLFSTLRSRAVAGTDFAQFLALGVLGFFVFRNTAQRSMDAIEANAALFAYRQVKPVDTVAVRCAIEGILQTVTALVLLGGVALFAPPVRIGDPLGVIVAFTGLWAFGTGIGLVLSVANELVPELARLARLMFTPLYFASGVMFSPHILPAQAQRWLLYNPITHGLESMRVAFFPGYVSVPTVNPGYLYGSAMLLILFGLALHLRFARRLVAL
jgi:capsular polysaccharide transport system permease protein